MAFVKSVDCRINRPHDNRNLFKPYTQTGHPAECSVEQMMESVLPDLMSSLYAYCLSLTGSTWEAEDLVQDTCVKMLASSAMQSCSTKQEMNWEAYLIRIARNTWIDVIRKREKLACKLDSLKPFMQECAEEERFEEIESAVQILVNELPPWQRAIYVLRDLMGYTTAETAEMLDTSEGAVKAALNRARSALERVRQSRLETEGEAASGADDSVSAEQLRSYLMALRSGDTARLIDLCLNRTDDPVAVAGTILQQSLPSSSTQPMMYGYSNSGMTSMMYGGGYAALMVA
ncbi:RNA polymerase sigma factor [Paenibacillus illinoisensis]|uniref:DNA-directed RNA polymerase subunit sigma n=1 Tax=Paenibacillus illinoisensis TaxID=59845 RepID=A0A2W0CAJ6_9BACL|nr:RNA polymerase sigma factor [Paenibacillus illinoisensis]MBM6383270.1 RNA polymerase sigma factor [Paenibacillus sp.]PYY27599.1 DNA-directed RNA polymerase subunit sigma [Paenibacillus illinoisensis]